MFKGGKTFDYNYSKITTLLQFLHYYDTAIFSVLQHNNSYITTIYPAGGSDIIFFDHLCV